MIDGVGGIGYDLSAGGLALVDNTRRPRLFKIVSGSNPYTADEVVLQESDGTKPLTGVYDVLAAEKTLYETTGKTSVRPNTIVEATPNPTGLGFYFTAPAGSMCSNLPLTFRIQDGIKLTRSGGGGGSNITHIYQVFRNITITADGCFEIGEPYCVEALNETCTDGEPPNSPQWWCIEGVCTEVYDGIVPPSYDAGPFATKTLCAAGCSSEPTVQPPCCPGVDVPETLTMTITGSCSGTFTLTYAGLFTWVYNGAFGTCSGGANFEFYCNELSGDVWEIATFDRAYTFAPTSVSCDPFEVVFSMPAANNGIDDCGCTGTLTITITG